MPIFDPIRLGSSAAGDYEIERSLRFNGETDDARLKRTSVASPTNVKVWTMSLWIKRDAIVNGNDMEMLFGNDYYTGSISTRGFQFAVGRNDFKIETFDGASSMGTNVSAGDYRDPTAWMHIVVRCNTPLGTQSSRMRVYVNGTDIGLSNSISQNQELTWNKGSRVQYLGCHDVNGSPTRFFRGYIAEAHFVDGGSKGPDSFAETDPVTGFYKPIKYTGTYGNNGWYLNFSDNSNTTATTLGKDYSGNGNNLTPTNFSVSSGSGNDSVTDTPTNNWCTFNSLLSSSYVTLTNGNLKTVGNTSSDNGNDRSSFSMKTGKWYAEFKITGTSATYPQIGVVHVRDADRPNNAAPQAGYSSSMLFGSLSGAYFTNGDKQINNSQTSFGNSFTTNDIIGVAFDADNGAVYFSKNNTFQNSGNPASGGSKTGALLTWTPSDTIEHYMSAANYNGSGCEANFGQQGFTYTPPTGYKALNSENLPAPTINLADKYFDTLLYTGNGSNSHAISGLDFQPDWVWIKARNATGSHAIFDAVRGATKRLGNSGAGVGTTTESTVAASLASFDSGGFTYGNENGNNNGETYAAWNWNAGGSTASNSNGSITSSVRANTTAGFSIATYTGAGGVSTIGHGLGVAPDVFIVKNRTSSSDWEMYWSVLGNTQRVNLNSTSAKSTGINGWNSTSPTSTVVTINGGVAGNNSGSSHVMYAFSAVRGYSKFGSYTANSNSNGSFIFTDFRPAWIMFKNTSQNEAWSIFDNKRDPDDNPVQKFLRAQASNAETSGSNDIDFLSNGFKLRTTNNPNTSSGQQYVYMAFAEIPFKYARAR